jgi:5-carboxymethyl-2-hydroxymuconate isomerase
MSCNSCDHQLSRRPHSGAYAVDNCSIADNHPDNAFADLVLRIGVGRTMDQKTNAGDAIMTMAKHQFAVSLMHHILLFPWKSLNLN